MAKCETCGQHFEGSTEAWNHIILKTCKVERPQVYDY